jgi:hypothetical protein
MKDRQRDTTMLSRPYLMVNISSCKRLQQCLMQAGRQVCRQAGAVDRSHHGPRPSPWSSHTPVTWSSLPHADSQCCWPCSHTTTAAAAAAGPGCIRQVVVGALQQARPGLAAASAAAGDINLPCCNRPTWPSHCSGRHASRTRCSCNMARWWYLLHCC